MSWPHRYGSDQTWRISKYTDLRFPSSNPVIIENDLCLMLQRSAKLLVLLNGNRVLHQIPLREPYPVVRFRDLSFFISLKVTESDIRFRFRTFSSADSRAIAAALSPFIPVQEHASKQSQRHSRSPLSSQEPQSLRTFQDSYDVYGCSGSDSMSSPYYNPSPCATPPPSFPNVPNYGTTQKAATQPLTTPMKIMKDFGTQTENPVNFQRLSLEQLALYAKRMLECDTFREQVQRLELALERYAPPNESKPKITYEVNRSNFDSQDSILRRF